MATGWQTYPIQHVGGLVTNLSPLQQGIQAPGSATRLVNFEPSVDGGYRRIEGFDKFDANRVPAYGEPLYTGQTSPTVITVSNLFSTPSAGDILSIAGVSGTYTIAAGGVVYNSVAKSAAITLTTSLASTPSDKAAISFAENTAELISGIHVFNSEVIAVRGGNVWESNGNGWTRRNIPSHGLTVLVNGAGQSGTTLTVDGLTSAPMDGETFSIAGVDGVYTVTVASTLTAAEASLTITPALASSPSDNAALTFLGADAGRASRVRFSGYSFDGTDRLVGVNGEGRPFTMSDSDFRLLDTDVTDIIGASYVNTYKNHLFFGKGKTVAFGAPFSDSNFTPAAGGGVINFQDDITGLTEFREQLIIFGFESINRLTGNTVADFVAQPITDDIGCVQPDTIQEVGGDIAFVGPDGVRMLSATDRLGDFGLAVASRVIQTEVLALLRTYPSFSSVILRDKNQYRLLGYRQEFSVASSRGILGTQFAAQDDQSFAWAETQGFKAFVAHGEYVESLSRERTVFANDDGFVYEMESGNSLDGDSIPASFSTPYLPITDPEMRKTYYKLNTYLDPQGSVDGSLQIRLDFNAPGTIQPPPITFQGLGQTAAFYGQGTYGVSRYGGRLNNTYRQQVIGSGKNVSIQYTFNNTNPPFSIDTSTLEYAIEDRQ